jgi:hypothetical protein
VRFLRRLVALGFGPSEVGDETESAHVAEFRLFNYDPDDFVTIQNDVPVDCAEEAAGGFAGLGLGPVCRSWLLLLAVVVLAANALPCCQGRFAFAGVFSGCCCCVLSTRFGAWLLLCCGHL